MAIIAHKANFFFDVSFGGGGILAGEGEGEEQGFRGSPHKREFPTKEELGNCWREGGIEPLRWL